MAIESKEARKALMAEEPKEAKKYFLTGCDLIDLCVGGAKGVRGIPAGVFINLIGDKSAGKSYVCHPVFERYLFHVE